MKNRTIIILIILISLVIFMPLFLKKGTKANIPVIDETDMFDKPIVSLISFSGNKVVIKAGMYAYGDITQDGLLDEMDIDFIDLLINDKLKFRDEQKMLADIDKDGNVTAKDIALLKDIINNKEQYKYNLNTDSLVYCVLDDIDNSNCNWQKDNTFTIDEEKLYYAYAKQESSNIISNYYQFKFIKYSMPNGIDTSSDN